MNERIKELWDLSRNPSGRGHDEQKFAQLIVAECVQVCMNEGASYEEKSAGAYQSNLYVTAIQRHFDESK